MLPFGLANPNARSIEFQGDVLWAGGTEGDERSRGITSWNLEKGTWKYFEQRDVFALRSDQVNRIVAENDTVWFGTQHGLVSFSEESNTWRRIDLFAGLSDNEIYDIAFDDTSLWIATGSGIDRISKRTLSQTDSLGIDQLRPRDFVAVKVNDVEVMRNLVWAATNEGIYVLDTTDDESGGYAGEIEGPFTRFITSISRFKNELWFGSEQGIDVFDVDKREWRGVPEGRFFPNTAINRIVADLKVVWAATDEGVLKYDRETKNWRAFTMEDGLLDNRVNDILLDGDHVWFATESGITSFYWNDPNRID
jgi:ligand-binding sensor domain-containing protein